MCWHEFAVTKSVSSLSSLILGKIMQKNKLRSLSALATTGTKMLPNRDLKKWIIYLDAELQGFGTAVAGIQYASSVNVLALSRFFFCCPFLANGNEKKLLANQKKQKEKLGKPLRIQKKKKKSAKWNKS